MDNVCTFLIWSVREVIMSSEIFVVAFGRSSNVNGRDANSAPEISSGAGIILVLGSSIRILHSSGSSFSIYIYIYIHIYIYIYLYVTFIFYVIYIVNILFYFHFFFFTFYIFYIFLYWILIGR